MQPEDNPLTVAKLHAAERDGTNAIVITEPCSEELMLALAETPIPVASIGIKDAHLKSRKGTMVFVHNDNAAIGDMGARHFSSLGRFNSYGFVLAGPDDDWARERSDAFCARIAASAPNAEVRVFPATADSGLEANIGALVNWIRALPKPAAIMAACDIRAIEVLDACGRAGVSVPDAVAVLGVFHAVCDKARFRLARSWNANRRIFARLLPSWSTARATSYRNAPLTEYACRTSPPICAYRDASPKCGGATRREGRYAPR